jgi:hypothetical protein
MEFLSAAAAGARDLKPPTVLLADFIRFTKFRLVIYYDDHIPAVIDQSGNFIK